MYLIKEKSFVQDIKCWKR